MRYVYPELRDYYRTRGIDFEVVDLRYFAYLIRLPFIIPFLTVSLRWGIRDEATDDHMTVPICMSEIKRQQNRKTAKIENTNYIQVHKGLNRHIFCVFVRAKASYRLFLIIQKIFILFYFCLFGFDYTHIWVDSPPARSGS